MLLPEHEVLLSELSQSGCRNRLLQALSREDFALLQPHLESMSADLRQVLIPANAPVNKLYFPETGFVSITAKTADHEVEVGLIGPEGIVGAMPLLLGSERTSFTHIVQAPGELLELSAQHLFVVLDASPTLRMTLLRYIQVLWTQTAQTAYMNATAVIESRLSRWLLMCQDRLVTDELSITHEFLAIMLGVQRTSVTLSLQALEGHGLIRARRGRIQILDRERMLLLADAGYGAPEAEYTRLLERA